MGTGIMGAIPISFRFGSRWRYSEQNTQKCKDAFIKHAPKDFFDFYNEEPGELEISSQEKVAVTYYVIKPKILLPNFKVFFREFHELIGDPGYPDCYKKFDTTYNTIVASNDLDKFVEYFDDHTGYEPTIFPYFRPAYVSIRTNLLVYQGSYKTLMEEESSLLHMERLLWAAMNNNPLAKVMRIGMSE